MSISIKFAPNGSLKAALTGSVAMIAFGAEAGEITRHSFASDTLGRDYAYTIYLPDGYDDTNLTYPALYLLHGSGGNENDWPVKGQAGQTLDRLIDAGEIPPMVVIMPASQSWWVDGHNEPAETAFFDDLIPHVEQTYDVIPERDGRMVAGLSAGGYGTVNFILEHPDMFASAAALSPAVYIPQPPSNSSGNTHPTFQSDGAYDPEKWTELNYPTYMDAYKAQDQVVPLYINSGDHDKFQIAYHAAVLYNDLLAHQPQAVEYRVIDGDHEWHVWVDGLADALPFMAGYVSRPVGAAPDQ